MQLRVLLPPDPAITGTFRPASAAAFFVKATAARTTSVCSSLSKVEASPVVPQATMASAPFST
jgi:hypothetical protein